MSENYQNSITDQICKVQTSKKLIALYDRLRYTSYNSYAQLHAKGEFEENGHKVHSLIGISIQDYSSGTGDKNIITRFHLAPEQIQFLLSRVTAGFPEFEWSQSKIFGVPDGNGYSTAQQFFISRHVYNNQQEILTSPCILIPIRIITSKQLTTFMEHTLFLVTSILPGYITGATGMQIMRLLSRHKRPFPLKNSFNLPN